MDVFRLIDPELIPPSRHIPSPAFRKDTLSETRAAMLAKAVAALPADSPIVSVETLNIPGQGNDPSVRVLSYRPTQVEGPFPVLLHLHGGGYVAGSPERKGAEHRRLAVDLGCVIYSVDYRLAPETTYPGAIEDCYAVLRWIHENSSKLNLDILRIGVIGESAGGGLAASLALLVRDRAEFRLLFQHLISPMLDDRTAVVLPTNASVGKFAWTHEDNAFGWSALLGAELGKPDVSPYAAAARAEDLSRLPPTYLAIAAMDLLMAEELNYAQRLSLAGVPLELHVYPGTYHGFASACPEARVSRAAARDSADAIARAFHG